MNKNEYENNKDMLVVKPLFHGRIDIDSTESYEDCVNDDYDDLGKGVVGYLEDTIESMGFKSTHSDIDMDGKCFKDRWESANITWESKSGELIVGTFEHSYYMECGFDDCHSFHGTLHFDNLSHENALKILDTVKDGCIDEELDVSGSFTNSYIVSIPKDCLKFLEIVKCPNKTLDWNESGYHIANIELGTAILHGDKSIEGAMVYIADISSMDNKPLYTSLDNKPILVDRNINVLFCDKNPSVSDTIKFPSDDKLYKMLDVWTNAMKRNLENDDLKFKFENPNSLKFKKIQDGFRKKIKIIDKEQQNDNVLRK